MPNSNYHNNNLLSDFERDEDEKMNFSFTQDGAGGGGSGAFGTNGFENQEGIKNLTKQQ